MNATRYRWPVAAGVLTLAMVGASVVPASAAPTQQVAASGHWQGPATTTTPMSDADKAALQAVVTNTVDIYAPNIPGMWVGVWDPTKGWAVASDGQAVVGGAAATPVDHSRIGSATKTFVATEILNLVDAKKLKLTDTIGTLLPALARKYPYAKNVTVQQMLGMRSGLPDYSEIASVIKYYYNHPKVVPTAAKLIDTALASADKLGKPKYANTNYLLLGEIARKVTGKPIWTLVNQKVRKLGLTQTRLPAPGHPDMPAPASKGYNFLFGQSSLAAQGLNVPLGSEQKDDVTAWGQAAGAMYSTLENLGAWAATGFGTKQLSPVLAAERLTFQPINDGALDYGLGLMSYGGDWVGHDGQAIGWETRVAYNTTTGAVLVIMVNDSGSLGPAVSALRDYAPGMDR